MSIAVKLNKYLNSFFKLDLKSADKELYKSIEEEFVNKLVNIITEFLGKIKGYITSKIQDAVEKLRGPVGSKISLPMMHKTDAGLRPYYLTHEFTITDAPNEDEIVVAIGGSPSERAHARTGDRYQDMKEMGI